jgi:hypothetical protein
MRIRVRNDCNQSVRGHAPKASKFDGQRILPASVGTDSRLRRRRKVPGNEFPEKRQIGRWALTSMPKAAFLGFTFFDFFDNSSKAGSRSSWAARSAVTAFRVGIAGEGDWPFKLSGNRRFFLLE